MHDLYKLEVAPMLRNIAWQSGVTDYVKAEHCHFFHSVNTKGSAQNTSATIGGHFHVLEIIEEDPEGAPVYKCSPPMKWVRQNVNGRLEKVIVPSDPNDDHTHEVTYVRSEVFTPRKPNTEAAKLQAMEANKGAPVPGIVG